MFEVKLPDLGEGIDSAEVLSVLVNQGDSVQKDQDVIEIETDKATAEVPTTKAGTVAEILVSPGDSIQVGATILKLDAGDAGEKKEESQSSHEQTGEPESQQPEQEQPEPDSPEQRDSDNGDNEQAAPSQQQPPSRPAPPSEPIQPASRPTPVATAKQAEHEDSETRDLAPAGPAVRRFAREVGVDIHTVTGTGPSGRITREDVLRVVRSGNSGGQSTAAAAVTSAGTPASPPATHAPDTSVQPPGEQSEDKWGPIKVDRMPKIRKTIAEQMHLSWSTIPRVTNFDDADITDLEVIRQRSKQDYAATGIKLTTMPFLLKAVAASLKAHPVVNPSLDMENGQIIYKQYVNIGIAVDTERGLIVPSLRNVDRLSIPDIARALGQLADNVRDGNFAIEDLRGSTFTISNLGAIGGTYSTPIVNPPEVAILLIGRAREIPVVKDGEIVKRLMMPLSLSYDHRLVDGAAAARFLNEIKSYLQAPSRLMLAP